jgi:coenzyme Q-binding protein COQ10
MPSFHESRTVGRPSADMFELVADFERYPEFVPFCLGARIRRRWTEPSGVEILIADMEIGYGSVRARFSTRDRLDQEKGAISIVNIDGPFKYFEARWSFRDLPRGGSRIDFSAKHQFSSPAFDLVLAPVFKRVVASLAGAFEKRAAQAEQPQSPEGFPPASMIRPRPKLR